MNAEEARQVHEKFKHLEIVMYDDRLHDPISINIRNYAEGKGYLDALSGPEVKALVEALEIAMRHFEEQNPNDAEIEIYEALESYRKAVGQGEK